MEIENYTDKSIVFFDGYCGICNGFVDFLITRDKNKKLHFAPIQGTTAKANLRKEDLENINTIIYLDKGESFRRSDAVLKSVSQMGSIWKLVLIFQIIPNFISDIIYNFVAANRYKWFKKREFCRMPSEGDKSRILP